jgi:APA family basic amino acid/polyamine antiporter
MSFLRKKNLESVLDGISSGNLKRTLGVKDLFLMGIGAIVGTGIFVLTGVTAAEISGPAVIMSYLFAGIVAIFVAFAYTEVATLIPSSGGLYAYTYVALGEGLAWVVGCMTCFYMMISASTVASGWSGYFNSLLNEIGVILPAAYTTIPSEGGIINLPATLISLAVTFLLVKGTSGSVKLNAILVYFKMAAILLFIVLALPHVDFNLWFNNGISFDASIAGSSSFAPFGIEGIIAGSAIVFFGYNGFDTLSTATEEAKNPEKDISIAIIGSIIVCILLYMLIAAIMVGTVGYNELSTASPLSLVLSKIGKGWGAALVAFGAFAGMTTVILMLIYAQSRTLLGISRDGLLPKFIAKVHPIYGTPYVATIMSGIAVVVIAGFAPLKTLGSLASIASLFSYAMVAVVLVALRIKMPNARRPFKCPAPFVISAITIISTLGLISTLLIKVGAYLGVYVAVVLVLYFVYSKKNSLLNIQQK